MRPAPVRPASPPPESPVSTPRNSPQASSPRPRVTPAKRFSPPRLRNTTPDAPRSRKTSDRSPAAAARRGGRCLLSPREVRRSARPSPRVLAGGRRLPKSDHPRAPAERREPAEVRSPANKAGASQGAVARPAERRGACQRCGHPSALRGGNTALPKAGARGRSPARAAGRTPRAAGKREPVEARSPARSAERREPEEVRSPQRAARRTPRSAGGREPAEVRSPARSQERREPAKARSPARSAERREPVKVRSPARSAERRQPAAARSPATPLLARQEPEEPWSPEAAAYEARLAELQRERQRAEREKARAEAEAYSTAATRLQAAERARRQAAGPGSGRRARREAAARDAAAARLQAAERGRTAKLETRRRRRRVEELGRGARVAAKAEAAVARAAEARAEEAPPRRPRALLRGRARRAGRAGRRAKDDARGGGPARTPARKDRSPSASSGRAAPRPPRGDAGRGVVGRVARGLRPRVATLRARPAASRPTSAVTSYLAQPAPTAPAAPTQPASAAGAACDRHGLKDCFLCSLQGAGLTSPLPAPRTGLRRPRRRGLPRLRRPRRHALPVAARRRDDRGPGVPERARATASRAAFCAPCASGSAPPGDSGPAAELALGGAARANRRARAGVVLRAAALGDDARAAHRAGASLRERAPAGAAARPVFAPRDPDRGPWHSPEARPMRVRPAVAPSARRRRRRRRRAGRPRAERPSSRAGTLQTEAAPRAGPGSSSRPAPRRKAKAAAPVVPARAPRVPHWQRGPTGRVRRAPGGEAGAPRAAAAGV